VCNDQVHRIPDDIIDGANSERGIVVLCIQIIITDLILQRFLLHRKWWQWRGCWCSQNDVTHQLGAVLHRERLPRVLLFTVGVALMPHRHFIKDDITGDDHSPTNGIATLVRLAPRFIADEDHLHVVIIKFLETRAHVLDVGNAPERA
jgi:hypothetical protein